MCEIIFLGSGGGRFNLIRQFRSSGGFLIKFDSALIHVDPGPGALKTINSLGLDTQKINGIIITHNHIDHYLEAPLIIEAMSGFAIKKGGLLIGSSSVIEGEISKDGICDRVISGYHLSKLDETFVFKPYLKKEFNLKKFNLSFFLEGVPVLHEDKTGFGFVFNFNNKKIAYTSDTEALFDIHPKIFHSVDLLIANCLKPAEDEIPGHLSAASLAKLLKLAKPKACIITHLGLKILQQGPSLIASKIEKESGVKTFAAIDGYVYNLENHTFKKFIKQKKSKKEKQQKLL
ncbi:MAG: MBL fold metallo-hydrolase [Candidatus Anstonellaceae archaeon]